MQGKEKLVILHSIGIIKNKSKETRIITYAPADILVGILPLFNSLLLFI